MTGLTEQEICVACGLCCDGSWYRHAVLVDTELERTKAAGFEVIAREGESFMTLPCPKFFGGKCSIYEQWRPNVCSRYRCGLLKRHESGSVSKDEALNVVQEAKKLFAELRLVAPDMKGLLGSEAQELLEARALSAGQLGLSPAAELKAVALILLFRRYFEQPAPSAPSADEKKGLLD